MNCDTLPLWKKGEPLTAYRLNKQIRAINFLLKTLGGVIERNSLANYNPNTETSFPGLINAIHSCASVPVPCIENGVIFIPVSGDGIRSAVWDETISTPQVVSGVLHLNPASNQQPGYISSVLFSSEPGQPSLQSGTLYLPPAGNSFPGYISAVEYAESSSSTSPSIINGKIQINPANYDSTSFSVVKKPGYISSVSYNSQLSSPCIVNGNIQINPADASAPGFVSGIELSEQSSIPDIYQGVIRIPPAYFDPEDFYDSSSPGYIQKISYDETRTSPAIHQGNIKLNPSNYTPGDETGTPGYISGVETHQYDPSDSSVSEEQKKARIEKGKIIIPLPQESHKNLTVENVSCMGYSAAPGVDGWVQTLYLFGLWTGQKDMEYLSRQLMRIQDNKLQVIQQISYGGDSWSDAS